MRHILTILILILIVSCNSRKTSDTNNKVDSVRTNSINETKEQIDTVKTSKQTDNYELDYLPTNKNIERKIVTKEYNDLIRNNLSNWTNYFSKLSDGFRIKDFKNYQTNILSPYQTDLGDKDFKDRFIRLYNSYLKWSPDSLKAIDIYSYTYILEYDSKGNIYGLQDIDCQIAIIDFKKNKRIILETSGSAESFHDSYWINNDSIIVTGISTDNGETFEPYYSMIDLTNFLCFNYKQNEDLELKNITYTDLIFKDIKFE
jgi:hypothetical protein